jgi:hypothetical protein
MKTVIDVTVVCSIEDQFKLLEEARAEIERSKPREDWEVFYPKTPTEALQQLIRTAVSSRLLGMESVQLHEIGHSLRELDLPMP